MNKTIEKNKLIKNNSIFILTSNIACLGEFGSLESAKQYAYELQKACGMCKDFNIGTYIDGEFVRVYDSLNEK